MDIKDIPCEIVEWILHESAEFIETGAFLGQMVSHWMEYFSMEFVNFLNQHLRGRGGLCCANVVWLSGCVVSLFLMEHPFFKKFM